jgi:hypothetical protein
MQIGHLGDQIAGVNEIAGVNGQGVKRAVGRRDNVGGIHFIAEVADFIAVVLGEQPVLLRVERKLAAKFVLRFFGLLRVGLRGGELGAIVGKFGGRGGLLRDEIGERGILLEQRVAARVGRGDVARDLGARISAAAGLRGAQSVFFVANCARASLSEASSAASSSSTSNCPRCTDWPSVASTRVTNVSISARIECGEIGSTFPLLEIEVLRFSRVTGTTATRAAGRRAFKTRSKTASAAAAPSNNQIRLFSATRMPPLIRSRPLRSARSASL